jgi:hypothetical protein
MADALITGGFMSDIFFAVKMVGITVLLVFLMQIRVGPATVEQHSLSYIRTSNVVETLNGVAQGAIKAMVQGSRWVSSAFDTNVGKVFRSGSEPGSRLDMFRFKRSESAERQLQQKAAAAAAAAEASAASAASSADAALDQVKAAVAK